MFQINSHHTHNCTCVITSRQRSYAEVMFSVVMGGRSPLCGIPPILLCTGSTPLPTSSNLLNWDCTVPPSPRHVQTCSLRDTEYRKAGGWRSTEMPCCVLQAFSVCSVVFMMYKTLKWSSHNIELLRRRRRKIRRFISRHNLRYQGKMIFAQVNCKFCFDLLYVFMQR